MWLDDGMTTTTATIIHEFSEEIDARAAVRMFREAGRTATFRRVNEYRGDRPCFWIVEVK